MTSPENGEHELKTPLRGKLFGIRNAYIPRETPLRAIMPRGTRSLQRKNVLDDVQLTAGLVLKAAPKGKGKPVAARKSSRRALGERALAAARTMPKFLREQRVKQAEAFLARLAKPERAQTTRVGPKTSRADRVGKIAALAASVPCAICGQLRQHENHVTLHRFVFAAPLQTAAQ